MEKQRTFRLLVVAIAAILIAGLGLAPPASAHKGHHNQAGSYYEVPTPWKDSGSYDPECAGYDMTAHFWARGIDSTRNVRGTDHQAFFYKNQYKFREVWRDNTSGEVLFVWRGKYKFEEYAATRVKKSDVPKELIPEDGLVGPIYLFKSWEKIRDVFKDADGNKLFSTRVLTFYSNLFDTIGDHAPGGTSLSFDVVKRFGHDPLEDASPCDYLPDPS